ncbi:MAG: helix-turn-helix protein [Proteobacteria bacterium]|nr:helix-turn-helix protein [Pseudomonadota bacterium]
MDRDLPARQLAYVRAVLARTGETEYSLAKKASLDHTTLLGFSTQEEPRRRLRRRTIDLIQKATGIPFEGGAEPEISVDVGPTDPVSISVDNEAPALKHAILSLCQNRKNAHPWLLRGGELADFGYFAGDIVVVDLDEAPRDGDVVCAQVHDFQMLRARTVFRFYDGGYLLTGSVAPELRLPIPITDRQVAIMGVVVAMLRPRQASARLAA